MTTEAYMREWGEICAAYCKRENAELLFVNTDSFGAQFPDGTLKHIYADELEQLLKGGAKNEISE